MRISIYLILLFYWFPNVSQTIESKEEIIYFKDLYLSNNSKNNTSFKTETLVKSSIGNAHDFMNLRAPIGALNEIVISSKNELFINEQIFIINKIISSSQISSSISLNRSNYNDDYKGWISLKKNNVLHTEVPLYESYSFFYITQFLYYLKKIGWIKTSEKNQQWWTETLHFIEINLWTKWYERSVKPKGNHYWYFLRGRTHMGSHWAGIAMYLNDMTQNAQIKEQTKITQTQYDLLLKRNLKVKNDAYIWNSTYDNVEGTFASKTEPSIIQDVSHGNHVVSYIIAAYEFGNPIWKKEDIDKLSNTVKQFMYNYKTNTFYDNVDGSDDVSRPGWGNFIGDGWVKLAKYDREVKQIMMNFDKSIMITKYNQELQFRTTLQLTND